MSSKAFPADDILAVIHDRQRDPRDSATSDHDAASKILTLLGGATLAEALAEIERLRTLLRSFAEPRALLTIDGTVPLRPRIVVSFSADDDIEGACGALTNAVGQIVRAYGYAVGTVGRTLHGPPPIPPEEVRLRALVRKLVDVAGIEKCGDDWLFADCSDITVTAEEVATLNESLGLGRGTPPASGE